MVPGFMVPGNMLPAWQQVQQTVHAVYTSMYMLFTHPARSRMSLVFLQSATASCRMKPMGVVCHCCCIHTMFASCVMSWLITVGSVQVPFLLLDRVCLACKVSRTSVCRYVVDVNPITCCLVLPISYISVARAMQVWSCPGSCISCFSKAQIV